MNTLIFEYFSNFREIPGIGLIADLPIFFLPLFLVGTWLYYTFKTSNESKRGELIHIFYACLLGLAFSYIIKQFVNIERPDIYLTQAQNLIMSTIPAKSFPSDHATVSFAFTFALFFTSYKKIGYIFLPYVILMNISRIIVGVHWPLDILAGSITGISASFIFFRFLQKGKLVKKLDILIIRIMKTIKLY